MAHGFMYLAAILDVADHTVAGVRETSAGEETQPEAKIVTRIG
jgi:hypothetical protein